MKKSKLFGLIGLAFTALYVVTDIIHLPLISGLVLAAAGVFLILFFMFLTAEFVEADSAAHGKPGTRTSGPNHH